ncbi:MAG: 4-hydroxy-tetrahydrodipicolinate synthase [Bacteroidota bacterium]
MTLKLKGTGVALVTPFTAEHLVDYPALQRLVRHVSDGGVDYLVVLGTTGESATISKAEKKEILSFVIQHNDKKLPIVYGLGGNHTQDILDTIRQTDFTGVDAILSVSPYYSKPSQNGIYEHYKRIADACPVPVLLYNIPGRTCSNVSAQTTLKLAKHPNIIGTKETSGDWAQMLEIAKGKPKDFLLLSGDDLLAVPMMSIGGVGAISVLANAFPGEFSTMIRQALAGEFEKANRQLFRYIGINALLYEEANPVGIKKVLEIAGICSAHVRLPHLSASEDLTTRLKKAIREDNLLKMIENETVKDSTYKKSAWL